MKHGPLLPGTPQHARRGWLPWRLRAALDTAEKQTMFHRLLITHMQCSPTLGRYRELGAFSEAGGERGGGVHGPCRMHRLWRPRRGPAHLRGGWVVNVGSRARASSLTRLDSIWGEADQTHVATRNRELVACLQGPAVVLSLAHPRLLLEGPLVPMLLEQSLKDDKRQGV